VFSSARRYVPLWGILLLLVAVGLYLLFRRGREEAPGPFGPARAATGSQVADSEISTAELRQAAAGANLVICVIDAARADHLGCYGYARDTTPNIDQLAGEALVFTNHFVQGPDTTVSTASLFTSQYPDTHLVRRDGEDLGESVFTIAGGLGESGFRTVLLSSNVKASPRLGVGLSFEDAYYPGRFSLLLSRWESRSGPNVLLRTFRAWLRENASARFFAYIHLLPPHQPYRAPRRMAKLFAGKDPPGFRPEDYHPGEFETTKLQEYADDHPFHPHPDLPEWINLYDANLRYADWAVAEVGRLLKEAEVLETTLLVVTSDHGESFGEHGYPWHSRGIHDEATHIPLLMRLPGTRPPPRRIDAITQTVDLLPTVFDLFELPYPEEEVQGRSLLPLLAGQTDEVNECAFTWSNTPKKYMVRSRRSSLLLIAYPKYRSLYDLVSDPGQKHNSIDDHRSEADRLMEAFRAYALAQRKPPERFLDEAAPESPEPDEPAVELAPDLEKELRALGYL
jgi:arylsulfatase